MRIKALALAVLLATSSVARPVGLPDLGDISESALPAAKERALGLQAMREIRADRAYVDDVETAAYVQSIGQRLAERSAQPSIDFSFFVISDQTLNAFALPGGFIGVHTGLILAAQSESELAGVLAHEIAHVTQKHIARLIASQSNNALLSLGALALAILAARSNPQVGTAAVATAQATMIQSQLDFTRAHEEEADRVGLQTLERAGFDTRGMARFFERLQRESRAYDSKAPSYLRTHPL